MRLSAKSWLSGDEDRRFESRRVRFYTDFEKDNKNNRKAR